MHMQKLVVAGTIVLALAACGGGAQEGAEVMSGESAPSAAAAAAVDPGITAVGVLHINIADMDRSVAWYQGVLGMETVRDSGGPSPTTIVAEDGAMMHTHVLKTPDDGFSMELVEVSGIEVRPQTPSVQDPGAIMLALVVADLDAVLAGARRLGLTVISDGGDVVVTEERGRQAMVRDADGVVSYLSQASAPDAASVHHDFTFLSADNLEKTVAFYNGVFGLGLDTPGDLNPTPERIVKLTGSPALSTFRLTGADLFAGTDGALRFQEFGGAGKTPVRHRVQDPGGPILTMSVKDFAGVMQRVEEYGGTIGDGATSATLAPDATVSWIRDPNGLLIRVSTAQ
ncbi:MAG: hypothetical protein HOP14_06845 [Acidobacteria bacterium]|nr:hypothetical protein [Acidobacteriota bacterium]